MTMIQSTYKGFRLTAIEQDGGGWMVEIDPVEAGKPVMTMEFREMSDEIASAQLIVDRRVAGDDGRPIIGARVNGH